jgi:HK97 family phage major capsid protein
MPKLHELLERRSQALTAWKAIITAAETEKRDLSAEDEKREGELKGQIADLDKQIERARAIADAERAAPAIVSQVGDGQWEDRARQFSITTAIRHALGESVDNGRERELSAELSRRTGRSFQGIAVPDEAFATPERRVMLTTTGASGLIPTQHMADQFIDRLRPSIILPKLGATVLDGLVGDVDIPRQTESAQAEWLAEDAPLTGSDLNFDDLQLRPTTVGALTSFSRRTLINAVPSIEALVRADLAKVIAEAVDLAALFGDGSTQPLGVINTTGVAQVSFASGPTWDQVLSLIASVEGSNIVGQNLGFALSAWSAKQLRATTKVPGDGSAGFIMDGVGQLAGYQAAVSSTVPGNDPAISGAEPGAVIFGDWSNLILASWSGVDILVNPYASGAYERGRVLVRAMRDVDTGVRHPEAFAFADDMPIEAVSG